MYFIFTYPLDHHHPFLRGGPNRALTGQNTRRFSSAAPGHLPPPVSNGRGTPGQAPSLVARCLELGKANKARLPESQTARGSGWGENMGWDSWAIILNRQFFCFFFGVHFFVGVVSVVFFVVQIICKFMKCCYHK